MGSHYLREAGPRPDERQFLGSSILGLLARIAHEHRRLFPVPGAPNLTMFKDAFPQTA